MSDPLGPVSARLEQELRGQVVRRGLVIWLDTDDAYSGFVDRLRARRAAKELPYDVLAYRGSHLELMIALEGVAAGMDPPPLVVHMPGFNEDSIRDTPVLELYRAGTRFRKGLGTLVTEAAAGLAEPAAIEGFQRQAGLTLEHADRWLVGLAAASEAGLRGELGLLQLPAVIDDLIGGGAISRKLAHEDARTALWEHLKAVTGIDDEWLTLMASALAGPEDFAFAAASWALAVEYVDDLRREPVVAPLRTVRRLPRALVDACRAVAAHLRERHPILYRRTAQETEDALAEEAAIARAEDLGQIDTFEFEERRYFAAAIDALAAERWDVARGHAEGRLQGASFWLDLPGSPRRGAWEVVHLAAQLGLAVASAGASLAAASLEAAVKRYQKSGAAVDLAHRSLEERWVKVNDGRLPEREALRVQVTAVRARWHAWADTWARDFSALCQAQGFVPGPALRQRTLFEDVVVPMATGGAAGPTVLFLVDALRYEMAEALRRELGEPPSTAIDLRARLAELPTITPIGMNALAPVADRGRLRPVLEGGALVGLAQREYQVRSPDTRRRAMHDRVGGKDCPLYTLDEILGRDAASLKGGIARARLVLVHVEAIDSAGEKGNGLMVFEQALQRLRAAWNLLREAGARRFVFTADHGFLLLDDSVRPTQSHGRKIDPWRRHALGVLAEDNRDEVRVPLAQLEYDDPDGLQLMMPAGAAVFDVGKRTLTFVHGGGSLQERVIPVLTVVHKHAGTGGDTLAYGVVARGGQGIGEFHSVNACVQVTAEQHALSFSAKQEVELGLRAVDAPEVLVELHQTRGAATIRGGSVFARVGADFEVFFKLTGPEEARVQVELLHPALEVAVQPAVIEERFLVARRRVEAEPMTSAPPPSEPTPAAARRSSATSPTPTPTPTPAPTPAAEPAVAPSPAPSSTGREWLALFADPAVRAVFEHLSIHGMISEDQAQRMLGSGRAYRQFSRNFEDWAKKAPFAVQIGTVGGIKRYTRE